MGESGDDHTTGYDDGRFGGAVSVELERSDHARGSQGRDWAAFSRVGTTWTSGCGRSSAFDEQREWTVSRGVGSTDVVRFRPAVVAYPQGRARTTAILRIRKTDLSSSRPS